MERQLSNPSRRHKRSLEGQECPDYYYYDTAISECTPCDHLCDDHEYQGTTGQCIDKCPKYYQRMSAELTTPLTSTSTVKSTPSITTIMDTYPVHPAKKGGTLEGDKGNAILAVVVAILVLAVAAAIGYLIWRKLFRKRDRTCCRRCRREKVKTPVTCSEEDSIDALGASQKPLLCGPIRQAENCPQQELSEVKQPLPTTDSYPYNMTFAEIGGARYAVLDDPLTSVRHSTIPKETYSTANADTDDSHVTVPKELSATANTDSCDSHITLPKETCSSVSSEHLNCKDTQSHKLEEKCYNVSKS